MEEIVSDPSDWISFTLNIKEMNGKLPNKTRQTTTIKQTKNERENHHLTSKDANLL